MIDDTKYYNAFNLTGEIGPARFKKLSFYFHNLENAWNATSIELQQSGFDEKLANKIIGLRSAISPNREWEKLAKEQISVVAIKDANYPKLLKESYNPPALLYVKGQLNGALNFPIAVVGSRKVSSYGLQVINDLVGELAKAGASIVSGMAFGADTAAHETAIANGAKTVAVLASGLDTTNLAPRKQIAEKIIASGALVSEYAFGKPALKHRFPLRNRIISGLSLGVLIVEAAQKSGALITAKLALDSNREVFAVPGGIYSPNSEGTNNLIKEGAKAITSCQEILEELNLTKIKEYTINKSIVPDSPDEQKIYSLLKAEPLHIDALAKLSALAPAKTSSVLTMMEMKGMVKNLGSGNYTVIR